MYKKIREELIKISEPKVKELSVKLSPNVDAKYILGIRVPKLRALAKDIVKQDWPKYVDEILRIKNPYFEEIQLAGLVIGYAKLDIEEKMDLMKKYIPLMNSWAITDTVCPTFKVKEKDLAYVWNYILPYTKSREEFTVRFSIIMMLDYFINDEYVDKVIKELNNIKNDKYYVQMAIAWTLAEIGIKYYDKFITYMKSKNSLDKFTYNKALQKLRESYRITDKQKDELQKMKIK